MLFSQRALVQVGLCFSQLAASQLLPPLCTIMVSPTNPQLSFKSKLEPQPLVLSSLREAGAGAVSAVALVPLGSTSFTVCCDTCESDAHTSNYNSQ